MRGSRGGRGADGVLVMTLDVPGEKVNTLGRERIAEFEGLLDEVERDAGVKDFGSIVLGHGGVMDRVDSLAFAAPAFLLSILSLPS